MLLLKYILLLLVSNIMAHKLGKIKILPPATNLHTGTLIFLHGSGDTGHGVREWIKLLLRKEFVFPHLRVLFPTAPLMPYTPLDGEPSNVWFDRHSISPDATENLESIDLMANEITDLVKKEIQSGISYDRIVIGGFSMGGAMAMHMGFRHLPQIGGVFALSSFLNRNSSVIEKLKSSTEAKKGPPFFMCHGDADTLVLHKWGEETFQTLEKLGVQGEFHTLGNATHELTKPELLKLYDWINKRVPQKETQ